MPQTTQQVCDSLRRQIRNTGLTINLDIGRDNQFLTIKGSGLSCIFYPCFLDEDLAQNYFSQIDQDQNLKQGEVKLPFNRIWECDICHKCYETLKKPKKDNDATPLPFPDEKNLEIEPASEMSNSKPVIHPLPESGACPPPCGGKLRPAPVKEPRLTVWYGEEGVQYTYSGKTMSPYAWTPLLLDIKSRIENQLKRDHSEPSIFSSVLINKYRDGNDSLGWHSDDEKELGDMPTIASLSLGAIRTFQFRRREDHKIKIQIDLDPGSLLVMREETQKFWQHQIPKRSGSGAELPTRINLTFRNIYPPSRLSHD